MQNIITLASQEFRDHIHNNQTHTHYLNTPAGILQVLSTTLGIYHASFIDDKETSEIAIEKSLPAHSFIIAGTEFQCAVWKALLTINSGTTLSYQQFAQKVDKPTAWRAVANAVGANPIAYFIPCHRVIRSDGTLGGYRWGLEKKKKLLDDEK
jgi:O-6-methylguanine DNA methyltransferase